MPGASIRLYYHIRTTLEDQWIEYQHPMTPTSATIVWCSDQAYIAPHRHCFPWSKHHLLFVFLQLPLHHYLHLHWFRKADNEAANTITQLSKSWQELSEQLSAFKPEREIPGTKERATLSILHLPIRIIRGVPGFLGIFTYWPTLDQYKRKPLVYLFWKCWCPTLHKLRVSHFSTMNVKPMRPIISRMSLKNRQWQFPRPSDDIICSFNK
jgi:hypothetical protein